MGLIAIEIVSEKNVLCGDPQQYLRFLPEIRQLLEEAGVAGVVVDQIVWEGLQKNLSDIPVKVMRKGNLFTASEIEGISDIAEILHFTDKEVGIIGCGADLARVETLADRLYLIKLHREASETSQEFLLDLKGWVEERRKFQWSANGNYSVIAFGKHTPQIEISVILSTYNQPAWLEKVLWGYESQSFKNFEVVIADDGSSKATFDLLEDLRPCLSYPVKHVWHEDKGFQKCVILNKAIVASQAEYLVFSDGDCIPRQDFLAEHMKFRKPGYFLSGGYHKLSMETSLAITNDDIINGNCFNLKWLKSHGMKSSFKNNKLNSSGFKEWMLNSFTPTKATWNGHNASGWRKDILAVNGFDERMEYGGEDREMGERLMNKGIRTRQIRYSAITIHLDHKRGYVRQEALEKNRSIRKDTAVNKHTRTEYGIIKEK